jgi:hypothetical protein
MCSACQTGAMRRSAVAVLAALTLALAPAASAFAAPSPAATPGKAVCQTSDPLLSNITGLATTSSGYAVVRPGVQVVYLLDGKCKRTRTVKYPAQANSPQDVTVASDGTIWVGDTGDADPNNPRPRIAVWKLPANGAKGTLYRFTYPNGEHYDCGAMVLSGNGVPVFVTKVTNGAAGVYVPTAALNASGTAVPLKKAGEFTPQKTGTPGNSLGTLGNTIVTGGAVSPDGTKVVLRTYSDAYEWSVTGGDVATAITGGKPVVTPLPGEPSGEAITFTRDGQFFLTAENVKVDTANPTSILRYTPQAANVAAPTGRNAPAGPVSTSKGDTRNWWDKLSLQQIAYLIGAVGVIGLLMVVGGIVGIRRSRSQQRYAALAARSGNRGSASVPAPMSPPDQSYGAGDPFGQQYDPYGNQYGDSYGDGYDQPSPRYPQDSGGYGPSYGAGHSGNGRGVGRAAPPRPSAGTGYPDGSYYGDGRH